MAEVINMINPTQFYVLVVGWFFTLVYSVYMAVLNRRQAGVKKLMEINNEQNAEILKVLRNKK